MSIKIDEVNDLWIFWIQDKDFLLAGMMVPRKNVLKEVRTQANKKKKKNYLNATKSAVDFGY